MLKFKKKDVTRRVFIKIIKTFLHLSMLQAIVYVRTSTHKNVRTILYIWYFLRKLKPRSPTYDWYDGWAARGQRADEVQNKEEEQDKNQHGRRLEVIGRRDEEQCQEWHSQQQNRHQKNNDVVEERSPQVKLQLDATGSGMMETNVTRENRRTVHPVRLRAPSKNKTTTEQNIFMRLWNAIR